MEMKDQDLNILYPNADWNSIPPELIAVLPRDKADTDRALMVIRTGYPKIDTILPLLMTWLQDLNWPVAGVLVPFLREIGLPLAGSIHELLQSHDDIWKYWVLYTLVDKGDAGLAKALEEDLKRIAGAPGGDPEGLKEICVKILSNA